MICSPTNSTALILTNADVGFTLASVLGVSCPGQDIEALAPDVLCRVHVGVGFMAAIRAPEYGLARSVAGNDVATCRATLAGVMRGYWDELPSVPFGLVLQLGM